MRKWSWIALLWAAASWAQTPWNVIPMTPPGGHVVPAGTQIRVRIDIPLSTHWSRRGDTFTATLVDALLVNGKMVLPPGTRLAGHVLLNRRAGIYRGSARLMIGLDCFQFGDRKYPIELTAALLQVERRHRHLRSPDPNADAVTGTRLVTTVPSETIVRFTLGAPVKV
jgi:hypothetical protein